MIGIPYVYTQSRILKVSFYFIKINIIIADMHCVARILFQFSACINLRHCITLYTFYVVCPINFPEHVLFMSLVHSVNANTIYCFLIIMWDIIPSKIVRKYSMSLP